MTVTTRRPVMSTALMTYHIVARTPVARPADCREVHP
jgi:hypothetical protein